MKTSSEESRTGSQPEARKHWLYRSENLPRLWGIMFAILLLSLLPEFFLHHHPHFGESEFTLDSSFGFYAWFGFLACAGMVALAKVLGIFLKRKDTYYDE
jgi:hypothetical protein